jgi:hypothetical protein
MQPPVISLDQRFTLCEDKRCFETIIVREKTAPKDAKFGPQDVSGLFEVPLCFNLCFALNVFRSVS